MPIFVVIAPNLFKLNKILLKDIQSDDETGRDDAVSLEKSENNLASCTKMTKDFKKHDKKFQTVLQQCATSWRPSNNLPVEFQVHQVRSPYGSSKPLFVIVLFKKQIVWN